MTGYIPWRMEAKRVKTIDKILFSSSKDDWETPQNLFDRLNDEFHFTLDPASSDYNAKCANHFTIDNDGLKQNWEGKLYISILLTADNQLQHGCEKHMKNLLNRTQLLCA